MREDIFYEEQRIMQNWVRILLYCIWGGMIVLAIVLAFTVKDGYVGAIILFASITIFVLLFRSMKLQTRIGADFVSYRFFPIHRTYRTISRSDIESMDVIQYDPLFDYGGWGIRFGRRGRAYTARGDFGLSIRLVNQKGLLIGTSKPVELKKFLQTH